MMQKKKKKRERERKKKKVWFVLLFLLLNIDSRCVIRNVCQTQIVLFFLQRLTCLMQRAITHWGCAVPPVAVVCACTGGWLCCCAACVCMHVWDKDHLCSGGSQWIRSQSALCQLAFDLSLSRLGLWLSHLAGHTRCSPSLSPHCLSLFFSLHTRCIQGVHLQATSVDTHTLMRVANTHVFQWLVLNCSGLKNHHRMCVFAIKNWRCLFLWEMLGAENITDTSRCGMISQDRSFVCRCVPQPQLAATICALNCGWDWNIHIVPKSWEIESSREAFYFTHTYQCKACLSLQWEDFVQVFVKTTSERHGGDCRWQNESWMDTAVKRSQKETCFFIDIMPLRW